MNLQEFSDEEVLKRGREALKLERYAQAADFFVEYCDRLRQQGTAVPAGVLASYAVALGHTRRLKEGIEICLKALSADRRNPHIIYCLAQLYVLADSKRKAIEVVERGLRRSPDHRGLLRIRQELGVRRSPPIPFLPRRNLVNVRLGKAIRKRKA